MKLAKRATAAQLLNALWFDSPLSFSAESIESRFNLRQRTPISVYTESKEINIFKYFILCTVKQMFEHLASTFNVVVFYEER